MNIKITGPVASSLAQASAFLGISPSRLNEQLLEDYVTRDLESNGTAFLAERSMMQRYKTRAEAEAVCERLEERAVSESLEGKSLTLVAEVLEEADTYRIEAYWLNEDGWSQAITGEGN
jgi:hypothetical protein